MWCCTDGRLYTSNQIKPYRAIQSSPVLAKTVFECISVGILYPKPVKYVKQTIVPECRKGCRMNKMIGRRAFWFCNGYTITQYGTMIPKPNTDCFTDYVVLPLLRLLISRNNDDDYKTWKWSDLNSYGIRSNNLLFFEFCCEFRKRKK